MAKRYVTVAGVIERYVEFMGGPDEVVAKNLLADLFEQLGYGSENGTWRCEFLSAVMELRTGNFGTTGSP